ncbi:DUF4209 domain-containing protein [Bacillus paranthracis]|uniref:DUF4209 domain-containing protein n=1 Tax=Bacillus paranthracis TaxID=2026186 RepID=UPI0021D3A0AD|nr:DUF4209 domain-containing protein [Bacillus paranthracis]MCU5019638.1 DUF4209 domain-containing protein [Bacillus paranthracis]
MERNLWDEINAIDCDVPECNMYLTIYNELNRILESVKEDNEDYFKLSLLKDIFYLACDLNDNEEPYKSKVVSNEGWGSISLNVFDGKMIDTLKEIISEGKLESPILLFRIIDVYFVLKKDYKIRKDLFVNLIESIDYCFSHNKYFLTAQLLERGFQLYITEVKNRKKLIEKLNSIINNFNVVQMLEKPIQILMRDLFKLIKKYRFKIDNEHHESYQKIGVEIAEKYEEQQDLDSAAVWWEFCATLFYKLKRNDCAEKCLENIAFAYYGLAQGILQKDNVNYHHVVHKMKSAIEFLQRAKGQEKTIQKWIKEKEEYQEKSMSQLKRFKSPEFCMVNELREIEEALIGKNYMQILFYIGQLASSLDYNTNLKKVFASKPVAEFLLQREIKNEVGKTIYISQGSEEFPLLLALFYEQHYNRVANKILHSIELLQGQYFLRIEDILPIINDNIFIPKDREVMVASGIREGLKNNYITSLSILIPQFENSIRYFLKQIGVSVTSTKEDSVEEEKSLGILLEIEQLEEVLGGDIVKDLQYLFVNKGGKNLRNRLAHGLMSEEEFRSAGGIYAFGLMLYIIFYFKIIY